MEGSSFPPRQPSASDNQRRAPPPPDAAAAAALHSVNRPLAKPWRRPMTPPPPRVYHVHPRGFRQLVQQLTGAPSSSSAPNRPLTSNVVRPLPLRSAPRMLPRLPPPPQASEHGVFERNLGCPSAQGESIALPPSSIVGAGTGATQWLSPSALSEWRAFPFLSSSGTMATTDNSNSSSHLQTRPVQDYS